MTSEELNNPNFHPGAIPDRYDPRDYQWQEIGAALPAYNWGEAYSVEDILKKKLTIPTFTIPVKDQNGSYSCGGQAWAYYGGTLEAINTGTFEERSAKFIYAQSYFTFGGSTGRDNCRVVTQEGWGLESLTPSYRNGYPPDEEFITRAVDITDEARQKASKSKALSYMSFDSDFGIDNIAQAIVHNHGVILGVCGNNNGTWFSENPAPPESGVDVWRHWLYAGKVAMINNRKKIGVINSWGKDVGNLGWQWLDMSFFTSRNIFSAWTLTYDDQKPDTDGFAYNFEKNVQIGDQNFDVKQVQHALKILGYFPASVPLTGFYGSITAEAVFKLQTFYGVSTPNRNHCGPKTRAILNSIFNKGLS